MFIWFENSLWLRIHFSRQESKFTGFVQTSLIDFQDSTFNLKFIVMLVLNNGEYYSQEWKTNLLLNSYNFNRI